MHQRCQVHYLRNALDHVSSETAKEQVLAGLRDVWSAPTRAEAAAWLATLITRLAPTLPRLTSWLETTASETLGVYALSDCTARQRLASTNSIEHDHMAVRRRTSAIRVFPNEASFIRLASALVMERNEAWLGRRYVLSSATVAAPEGLQPAA